MFRWINNLPVKLKTFAASAVLVACLAGLSSYAFITLKHWQQQLDQLSRTTLAEQVKLRNLRDRVSDLQLDVFRYVAWSNNSVNDRVLADLRVEINSEFQLISRELQALANQPKVVYAQNVEGIVNNWRSFSQAAFDTIEIAQVDPPMGTMMLGGTDDRYQHVAAELRKFSDAVGQEAQFSTQTLTAEAEYHKILFGIVGALGILLGLAITVLITRSIANPIQGVTAAMARVARGETSGELKHDGRRDEIGQMLLAISSFRDKIVHLAHRDALTNLPNRAAFNACLSTKMRAAEAEGRRFGVMCIDLDGFKQVNDVYGHSIGDLLLRQVADRLCAVANGVFVARLGGDEFTMIADTEECSSISELIDRLLAAFVDDFELDGHRLRQALSIGVAVYPDDGTDAETLMKNADAALYRAKAANLGSVQFFEANMAARLRDRAALQADLKSAIQHNELRLYYQPQLKMTGEITGFEALARWQSPKRGMVLPSEFIPLAEESSLILLIGEWVLREACREAASWSEPLRIAVNVSPIQFRHGDLPKLVHSVLLETGLAPNRLELEITEGVLIEDFSRAVSILRRLKSLGVQIALDDFGTGYSSLSYLHSFPFDKIKIDSKFILDLESNRHSVAIIRAVIGLSRSLNIPTLAEGVETQAQHQFLAREGCDEVQGYLTGRPLMIADYAGAVGRKMIDRTYSRAG